MKDDKLVLDNIKLIYKIIKDLKIYWNTEDEYQDYYDAGLEGLIRGAKKYDYSTKPSTYLYQCIKNQICRYIYQSETDKRKINKENKLSFEQYIDSDDGMVLEEIIASKFNLEEEIERSIKLQAVVKEINKMKNKIDSLVFKMYFGLEGRTPKTVAEIAKELGVSTRAIYKRIKRVMNKLKEKKDILEEELIKNN